MQRTLALALSARITDRTRRRTGVVSAEFASNNSTRIIRFIMKADLFLRPGSVEAARDSRTRLFALLADASYAIRTCLLPVTNMACCVLEHEPRRRSQSNGFERWCALLLALAGSILATSGVGAQVVERDKQAPAGGRFFPPEAVEFFEARVRPILVERCVKCHGP